MLTAKTDSQAYVEAQNGQRGVVYRCRGCSQSVVFKSGRVKVAHFAHRPNAACSYGAVMSPEHLRAQQVLAEGLRGRGIEVELEAYMPSMVGDRRIDVLAWPPGDPSKRIAIEVQASDLTVELIDARTRSYQNEGVAPLWLRLYDFSKWEGPECVAKRKTIWIDKHHARAWEHWAYDHLGEHLWFMDSQTYNLWRGVFIPAHSYQEATSWYGAYGDEQSAGGVWRDITRWVELELEGPYATLDLRLKRGRVEGPDGKTRLAAWLLPVGENEPPKQPCIRAEFIRTDHFYRTRELQTYINGQWQKAKFHAAPSDWRELPKPSV